MFRKIFGSVLIILGLGVGWFGLQVLLAGYIGAIIIMLAGFLVIVAGVATITGEKPMDILGTILSMQWLS